MTFTQQDKLKALAIVSIFETSRPFGNYAAYAVLNDGAGVSYGIGQFTHRSGSLLAVIERYLKYGGSIAAKTLAAVRPQLGDVSSTSIWRLAADGKFRAALRAAAVTPEMKEAQNAVAQERYLQPAITECERRGFRRALSLAVIYDSLVHGSFYRVARGVAADRGNEREWITAYVRRRDAWLTSFSRLRPTRYRTRFLLGQIAVGNWDLHLPITVQGEPLTEAMFEPAPASPSAGPPGPQASLLDQVGSAVNAAADRFDRVESVVTAVVSRKDAAKSLWTTVLGTVWQAIWAAAGFASGMPGWIWLTAAVFAASLMLLYLHRQIELGKIRERSREVTI